MYCFLLWLLLCSSAARRLLELPFTRMLDKKVYKFPISFCVYIYKFPTTSTGRILEHFNLYLQLISFVYFWKFANNFIPIPGRTVDIEVNGCTNVPDDFKNRAKSANTYGQCFILCTDADCRGQCERIGEGDGTVITGKYLFCWRNFSTQTFNERNIFCSQITEILQALAMSPLQSNYAHNCCSIGQTAILELYGWTD